MKTLFIAIVATLVAPLALASQQDATSIPTGGQSAGQSAKSSGKVAGNDARSLVASKIPGAKLEDVHATPIPGLFEIMRGTDAAFVSSDGRYAITGDLYDLRTNVDLTENQRREMRLRLLAEIPESQMVIFGAQSSPHTVTVFTDVDCAYCRKLHSEIGEYNRLGIRVRYIFYPRTGPDTESWVKAEQVWCAPNRNEALTRAKLGETLHDKVCPHTPVAREYELGQEFGLEGTPAIILANGDMLPGYVSPTDLAQELRSIDR